MLNLLLFCTNLILELRKKAASTCEFCHARNECVHLDACSGFEHIWGALVREGRGGVVVGEVVWWCTFLFRSMREVMNNPVDLLPDVQ